MSHESTKSETSDNEAQSGTQTADSDSNKASVVRSHSAGTLRRRSVNTSSYSAFYNLMANPSEKREQDRRAARTEGLLNVQIFLKTLAYELPHTWVGGALCVLVDGLQASQSRQLAPELNFGGIVSYLFATCIISFPYAAVILAFCLENRENEWSLIEPLQLIVYYGLWKVTLAAKHAVAGSLHSNGLYGLDSSRFVDAERMARIQFNCWVMGQANQPGAVLEELYTACLRNDFDLAELEFDVGSEEVARKITKAVEWWKIVAATSLACKREPVPDWHPSSKNHHNSKWKNPALPYVKPTKKQEASSGSEGAQGQEDMRNKEKTKGTENKSKYIVQVINPEAEPVPDASQPDKVGANVTRNSHLPRCPVSRYADNDQFCLFETFFKDTNDTRCELVEELLRKGKVPATYLCFLVGVQNWRATPRPKMMMALMCTVFLMVFLPNICRAFLGKDAFGSTQEGKIVLAFSCLGSFFPIMLLFAYNVNCSVEMLFRYNASTMMRDFLLPEGAKLMEFKRNASGYLEESTLTHIHVSLSRACNVVSWGAVRELMHGASFCPFMHAKANVYIACSFAAAIGVSSIASFGGMLLQTENAGVEVSLPGVIKSLCFSLALGIYVLLAYSVNFSTRYHRQEIAKARISVLAEINELEKRMHSSPDRAVAEELAELRTAAELLQVVDKQTTVSDHANPVRAMGLVAEPAVLSIIMSILIATLYVEVQKVLATMFVAESSNAGNSTI